jgi:hypothetical protein
VSGHIDLPIGATIHLDEQAGLLALDGERRLPVRGGTVEVVAGPRVIDLDLAFRDFGHKPSARSHD